MIVTKKQLANYLGVHRHTARKKYRMYLDLLEVKRDYLFSEDIAEIDEVPHDFVLSRL